MECCRLCSTKPQSVQPSTRHEVLLCAANRTAVDALLSAADCTAALLSAADCTAALLSAADCTAALLSAVNRTVALLSAVDLTDALLGVGCGYLFGGCRRLDHLP